MAVLVTGATGLIGRALLKALDGPIYAASRSGTVPDGVSSDVTGSRVDLLDESSLLELPWDDIRDVIHLAAYTDPRGSLDDPHTCFRTNATGTSALLARSLDAGVDRFIHTSSYWVYDPAATGRLDESTNIRVETPYGASKAAADLQCSAFREQYDLAVTTLRPFNIYGPSGRRHQVVPEFIDQAVNSGVIEPHPGNPVRDFLYVDDLIDAILGCIEANTSDVFNVGSGVGTSIRELGRTVADLVERLTDTPVETNFTGDPNRGDEKIAEISKLQAEIDWAPRTPLSEGIESVIAGLLKPHHVDES